MDIIDPYGQVKAYQKTIQKLEVKIEKLKNFKNGSA